MLATYTVRIVQHDTQLVFEWSGVKRESLTLFKDGQQPCSVVVEVLGMPSRVFFCSLTEKVTNALA